MSLPMSSTGISLSTTGPFLNNTNGTVTDASSGNVFITMVSSLLASTILIILFALWCTMHKKRRSSDHPKPTGEELPTKFDEIQPWDLAEVNTTQARGYKPEASREASLTDYADKAPESADTRSFGRTQEQLSYSDVRKNSSHKKTSRERISQQQESDDEVPASSSFPVSRSSSVHCDDARTELEQEDIAMPGYWAEASGYSPQVAHAHGSSPSEISRGTGDRVVPLTVTHTGSLRVARRAPQNPGEEGEGRGGDGGAPAFLPVQQWRAQQAAEQRDGKGRRSKHRVQRKKP